MKTRRGLAVILATLITAGMSGCGEGGEARSTSTDPSNDLSPSSISEGSEQAAAQPRIAVTYDGGVMVVDATTGDVMLDEALNGYLRVSPAGDERHVMIAGEGGWRALDLGSWGHEHGDHGHHYSTTPELTDIRFEGSEPGHVVPHEGRTVLFDDGTGEMIEFDPHDLADGAPDTEQLTTDEPHHGVAVRLASGNLIHTVGDAASRSGIRIVSPAGEVIGQSEKCPGVHGEAFAGDVAVFGCEDGALIVDGRRITKVSSPDAYGRIGNQAGSPDSPVLLGDYKVDADAELERPTRISLIDTHSATLRLVDLGTSYTFRSLGRGPEGEAVVLGTDGHLHVIDPQSAKVTAQIPVVKEWREPLDWQVARPTLKIIGETAYVTEPARDAIHVVNLTSGTVGKTIKLPHTPDEIAPNAG